MCFLRNTLEDLLKAPSVVCIRYKVPDKLTSEQIQNKKEAYVAADGTESAVSRKIPLWAFGFLY